jgi:Kef-type K+ transport system membrane component KefB
MPLELSTVARILVALAAINLVSALIRPLLKPLRQPPVVADMLAGILLGPTIFPGGLSGLVLDPGAQSALGVIAELGAVLYLFVIGLKIDLVTLRADFGKVSFIATVVIAVPFAGALAAAPLLFARMAPPGANPASFAIFLGTACAITAFPVLARILEECDLQATNVGRLSIGIAAIGDLVAWCLLALAVSAAHGTTAVPTLAAAGAYVVVLVGVVGPFLRRYVARSDHEREPSATTLTLVLAAALVSAVCTAAIGLHTMFGAFLVGLCLPADGRTAAKASAELEPILARLLLPAFFALSGMRTRLDLALNHDLGLVCVAVTVGAAATKVGGAYVAARLVRVSRRDSLRLGVLLNTRGLVELIVLNVALTLGVINVAMFSVLVVMALATTCATAPLLALLDAQSVRRARPDVGRNIQTNQP